MKLKIFLVFFGVGLNLIAGERGTAMELKSAAFKNGEYIPKQYTGQGPDISPPLFWADVPEGTKSFALICDDPDAPVGTWVHWVIYAIPADTRSLPEGVSKEKILPDAVRQGVNDFDRIGYGGPMPPPGKPHRYFFTLYALRTAPDLPPGITARELRNKLKGLVLEEAQIMGLYKR